MAAVASVGFALGAWLSFKFMRRGWLRARRYIAAGAVTRGVVIEHIFRSYQDGTDGGTRSGYHERIEYNAPSGGVHRVLNGSLKANPLPLGAPIEVAYDPADPSDPSKAVLVDKSRKLWIWGWIMAVTFAVLAVGNVLVFIITTTVLSLAP